MNRLQEIEQRLSQIKADVEARSAEMTAEELGALETEVNGLQEERGNLNLAIEQRSRILNGIANNQTNEQGTAPTVLRNFQNVTANADDNSDDKYSSMSYRKAFMQHVTRGTSIPVEYRADAIGKTTDVGAVIPTVVLNKIVEKLESTGKLIALVTRTAYKGGVSIPKSTVKPSASWVNEGATSDTVKHTISSSGMITFAYHKLRCAVAVSFEVDNMSIPAFETLVVNNIVEAMTKAIETAIISGSGTGCPKGITSETANTEISVVAPAYADLISAEAALPEAYENGAVWCMSKNTFMQYYGLTDDNGQPIGRINYGLANKPERFLLGRPVVCCDDVSSYSSTLTAGTIFGFIFKFSDYVLNTNYAMGVKKYEDNETDDMITKGIMIVDGKAVDINSYVPLKKIAQA